MALPIIDYSHLTIDQKIVLASRLQQEIERELQAASDAPLSAEILAELERREIAYKAGEMQVYSWSEVRTQLGLDSYS